MQLVIMNEVDGFFPIESSFLDICDKPSISTLKEIDDFTKQFTKEEIFESLIRSNIKFPKMDENTRLMIIYHEGKTIRRNNAYTKDDSYFLEFDELEFLKDNIDNKDIINQLKNSFACKNHISEELLDFIMSIESVTSEEIEKKYKVLDYKSKRSLKEYIFENVVPRLEKNKLQRKREI